LSFVDVSYRSQIAAVQDDMDGSMCYAGVDSGEATWRMNSPAEVAIGHWDTAEHAGVAPVVPPHDAGQWRSSREEAVGDSSVEKMCNDAVAIDDGYGRECVYSK